MNLQNILSELENVDGEIYDRLAHVSRRHLFSVVGKKAAAAAAPMVMASALTSAYGQSSSLPANVVDVLNFALTLEYLEYEFYEIGTNTPGLIPANLRAVFEQLRRHGQVHVQLLRQVLGSQAVSKPNFDFTAKGAFPTVFSNFETFIAVSQAFEDTGVRAYKGQAPNLMNAKAILEVALQIHATESAHAARVRYLRGMKGWIPLNMTGGLPQAIYAGEDNTTQKGINLTQLLAGVVSNEGITEAFDEPLTKQDVLNIVAPFLA